MALSKPSCCKAARVNVAAAVGLFDCDGDSAEALPVMTMNRSPREINLRMSNHPLKDNGAHHLEKP
jgi:hypothetical protein